jgi:hypothetical protein
MLVGRIARGQTGLEVGRLGEREMARIVGMKSGYHLVDYVEV